jgi:hypothetical protein
MRESLDFAFALPKLYVVILNDFPGARFGAFVICAEKLDRSEKLVVCTYDVDSIFGHLRSPKAGSQSVSQKSNQATALFKLGHWDRKQAVIHFLVLAPLPGQPAKRAMSKMDQSPTEVALRLDGNSANGANEVDSDSEFSRNNFKAVGHTIGGWRLFIVSLRQCGVASLSTHGAAELLGPLLGHFRRNAVKAAMVSKGATTKIKRGHSLELGGGKGPAPTFWCWPLYPCCSAEKDHCIRQKGPTPERGLVE